MNLLFSNDQPGSYPASYYAATARPLAPFAALDGEQRADLCVIGAGYTGLSAALHAAQAGLRVVVLDAQRVGFGASGRNGGQVGNCFNWSTVTLAEKLGSSDALKLHDMALAARDLTISLARTHAPDAGYTPGLIHAVRFERDLKDLRTELAAQEELTGPCDAELLGRDALAEILGARGFIGGSLDMGAGHLHPLRYAFGLARAAQEAGAMIFENSPAIGVDAGAPAKVRTASGSVRADHVIIATNGYGTELAGGVAQRVMPINNFLIATEPLGERANSVLSRDYAVHDDRFVVNYFRLSEDKRLIFGGGESYGYRFPADIEAKVRRPLERLFPQLKGIGIDYAWGGTLAITMSRLPYVTHVAPNILSASGYSGQGVALAGFAGKLMADAIKGEADGFDTLARLPSTRFPGGGRLRSPLLALAMSWYALRDCLGL